MNIRVLGLGNVLMSDDGFGPYVARVLEAFYEVRRVRPPRLAQLDAILARRVVVGNAAVGVYDARQRAWRDAELASCRTGGILR